jgi:hypothetical protein
MGKWIASLTIEATAYVDLPPSYVGAIPEQLEVAREILEGVVCQIACDAVVFERRADGVKIELNWVECTDVPVLETRGDDA